MKKIFASILLLAMLCGCSTVPLTGRKQVLMVSDQEILSMSLQEYGSYMKKASLSSDKEHTEMVRRVGGRIATAVETYLKENGLEQELANFQWEFNLVKDNTANAFCMPGGKIVVNDGILPYTRTESGLAVVIGHEVAHAVAKHSNEQVSQQMLLRMGGNVLGKAVSAKSQMAQIALSQLYGIGSQVGVLLPYSRQHEYEADHLGLIFMSMAGYDPQESVAFWKRMSSETSKGSDFLSTHPADHKRIAALEKSISEAMKYAPEARKGTAPTQTSNGFRLVY